MVVVQWVNRQVAFLYLTLVYVAVFGSVGVLRRIARVDRMQLRAKPSGSSFLSPSAQLDESSVLITPSPGKLASLATAAKAAGKRWVSWLLWLPCLLFGWDREQREQRPPTRIYTMF